MSLLSQFAGGRRGPVTSLVNGSALHANVSSAGSFFNAVTSLSGALTAATLKTMLTVSGRGRLNAAGVYKVDATSRTIRVKITVDGVVITDKTSSADTTANNGLIAVGAWWANAGPVFQPIDYQASLLIEIASSLSETDKLAAFWNYEVWA